MFRPIVYSWEKGELQQLPVGEKLALSSFQYVIRYPEPTLVWQIHHGLGIKLPNIPYACMSAGQYFFVGVNEELSDEQQTTLYLTQPMSGDLFYQIPD